MDLIGKLLSRSSRSLRTAVNSFANTRPYHTIQAIPRECTGSRVSDRDRQQGRIPAVVFSQSLLDKDPSRRVSARKQLLTTEKKQIRSILKEVELPFFCSTTFQLQIRAGSGSSELIDSGRVLPIQVNNRSGSV